MEKYGFVIRRNDDAHYDMKNDEFTLDQKKATVFAMEKRASLVMREMQQAHPNIHVQNVVQIGDDLKDVEDEETLERGYIFRVPIHHESFTIHMYYNGKSGRFDGNHTTMYSLEKGSHILQKLMPLYHQVEMIEAVKDSHGRISLPQRNLIPPQKENVKNNNI